MKRFLRRSLLAEQLERRECLTTLGWIERDIEPSLIGSGTQSLTAADFDQDGDVDLVVLAPGARFDSQLLLFENLDGRGSAWRTSEIGEPTRLLLGLGLSTGDLDQDGDLDLIGTVNAAPSTVFWFENLDGDGTFGARQDLFETPFSRDDEATVADLDGDGDLDLLTGSYWLENVNNGERFETQTLFPNALYATEAIDVDADGDFDLVAVNAGGKEASVFLNETGWGTFDQSISISLIDDTASTFSSGDFDADGDVDLVFAGRELHWFENIGNDQFADSQRIDQGEPRNFLVFARPADADQDGDLDLVVASPGERQISWYENDGAGSFSEEHLVASSVANAFRVSVTDMNGDAQLDVVFPRIGELTWYPSIGATEPEPPVSVATSLAGIVKPAPGDMDNDGDVDIVVGSRNQGAIVWYENVEGGWGRREVGKIAGETVLHSMPMDVDGDDDLDVVGGFFNGLYWFENSETEFTMHSIAAGQTVSAGQGDLDGDGDSDIAAWIDGEIRWFQNTDGAGTFASHSTGLSSPNKGDSFVSVNDFDGDGQQDILVVSRFNDLAVWLKNVDGGATFEVREFGINRLRLDNPTVTDIDDDGDFDILNDGGDALRNDGRGNFEEWNAAPGALRLVGAADLDHDGDLDHIVRSNSGLHWGENRNGRVEPITQTLVPDLGFDGQAFLVQIDPNDAINILVATVDSSLYWLDFVTPGDVNRDGTFDSADLVAVLAAGEYDDGVPQNSTFETGDWNGDGEFDSSDLVAAFQTGYTGGPLG